MEKAKQLYKNSVFKVVIQECERSKNGFLAKIAWHYLCQDGRKTGIFVHTICFGQTILLAQNSVNLEAL